MTLESKRSLIKLAGWTTLAAAAGLVGCSKQEAAAPEAAAPASAPVAAASAAAPASAAPVKIAFAYLGVTGDAGWTFGHERGRKELQEHFGDKIATTFVEKVPEGPDAERIFRDMASQGNQLIFGTSFGYMDPMMKVAADNPTVKFEHATGYKTADNLSVYDSRTYQGAYMLGILAGGMSKGHVLGFVGSVPVPEVLRNINAFTLGAQSVYPKIKVKVVWINEWYNPPKEGEAATSLINAGADVLLQNTDSTAVLQTAEKAGKYAFGWDSNMSAFAPKAHLASAVINWGPYYIKTVQDLLDGKWTGNRHEWWGVAQGAIDIESINDVVPADLKAKVDAAKAGLKDGSLEIWKGPITSNEGKVEIAKDAVADDKFLGGLNFFVKGIEGKVPGGDKK